VALARTLRLGLALVLAAACAACTVASPLPRGPAAYQAIAPLPAREAGPYRIKPLDKLSIAVLDEPELSASAMTVDPSGMVSLPRIGPIMVAGMTNAELTAHVTQRLGRYLKRPSVSVNVESASQTVSVEGQVNHPGVFGIPATSSLLETLAMAQSPTRLAALDQIVVFREIDGQRAGAVFDLRRIRAGIDPDPVIVAGDRIVVGYSALNGAWVDFLSATPVINVFRYF